MRIYHDPATGHRVVYYDLAVPGGHNAPPLVCLHGLGTTGMASFACLLPYSPFLQHRTLVPDLVGFGLSDKPSDFGYHMEEQARIVSDLLDACNVREAIVVGHSMGGAIAIRLAFDRPDLVARLIVAEGNLDPKPGFVSGLIAAQDEDDFLCGGHDQFIKRMRADGAHKYLASFLLTSPIAAHRSAVSLISPRSPTYRDMLYQLEMPRIYVFGEETLPDPDETNLVEDGVRVAIVPGAGHDMMNGNPSAFSAIVDAEAKSAGTIL